MRRSHTLFFAVLLMGLPAPTWAECQPVADPLGAAVARLGEVFQATQGTVEVRDESGRHVYTVDSEITHGAFGVAAYAHGETGTEVVIKEGRTDRDPEENRKMLLAEAAIHAALDGTPELPRFLGLGRSAAGNPVLVMSRVKGERLVSTAATRADPGLSVRIVRRVLRALMALNAIGRRHGDLHAGNILIVGEDPETVVVIDLGMAGLLAEPHPWGKSAWGTRDYEQTTGDLYAAGVILLDLIVGVPAEVNLTRVPEASLLEHLARLPDPGLRAVIAKAIDPDPTARYPTAGDFDRALEPYSYPSLPLPGE